MKIRAILQQLSQDALEALARQRLSHVTDIRLPSMVLVDELGESLTSFAYVSSHVVLRHPPNFAIIHLLINAPDYSLPTENFRQHIREETDRMIALACREPIFPKPKQYDFYMKLLAAAWEYEQDINPSEANLLRILREELRISIMEHFVMEHHPDFHRFWRSEAEYENERNHLRNAGILFTYQDQYVLPEETVLLIRRAWGFELSGAQFRRLLDILTNDDLRRILEQEGLNVSGASDEKKARILDNYVLPRASLDSLSMEGLRAAARSLRCRTTGTKDELIESIIDWLDSDEDQRDLEARRVALETEPETVTETRELTREALGDVLRRLTNETLYDLLSRLAGQHKSGAKEQRVNRLLDSPFSEQTLLSKLTNETLYDLCKQIGLQPYGIKDERIGRIIEAYKNYIPPSTNLPQGIPFINEPTTPAGATALSHPPLELQLKLLPTVRNDFPYLSEPEQIVLSYLLDFKSLSDPELDKLVQRFALPWFLPKAQMTELIEKLKSNGRDIIKIRALGDHNIYQILS